jgi:hypothetical protein
MRTAKSKFLTLVAVAIVSSVVTLFLVLGTNSVGARPQQYTGNENHVITLEQAVKYIQNFKNFPKTPTTKGAFFGKSIFDKILAQPGCVGIRFLSASTDVAMILRSASSASLACLVRHIAPNRIP